MTKDVTLESWKILNIVSEITAQNGRVTLGVLSDLARGLGGGLFAVTAGGGGKKRKVQSEEKGSLDLGKWGGKVELGKDDMEGLLIHLMLQGYLEECEFPV